MLGLLHKVEHGLEEFARFLKVVLLRLLGSHILAQTLPSVDEVVEHSQPQLAENGPILLHVECVQLLEQYEAQLSRKI